MSDVWHILAWYGKVRNGNMWFLEYVVRRARYFFQWHYQHNMTTVPASIRFNASNGAHVVGLVEIAFATDAPLPPHDGKANL